MARRGVSIENFWASISAFFSSNVSWKKPIINDLLPVSAVMLGDASEQA